MHLEITDPLYVDQVKIRTDVTPEKVFHAEVLLKNGSDVSRTISLAASVAGEWKRDVPQVEIPAHGEKWISISGNAACETLVARYSATVSSGSAGFGKRGKPLMPIVSASGSGNSELPVTASC